MLHEIVAAQRQMSINMIDLFQEREISLERYAWSIGVNSVWTWR